ncbi:MAG: GNAT family N-acetyltransferase [Gammaproteobacteria bacterium]
MIRLCAPGDFAAILAIVNDAAEAYRGVIPADCWHDPYMDAAQLAGELNSGVAFWAWVEGGELLGVMGLQDVRDAALIRHAYVRTARRGGGIGGRLLAHLKKQTALPTLVGTWAAAEWAIQFYEKHDYRLVTPGEKERLLRQYWSISDRQIDTSVVLADPAWRRAR